VISLPLNPIALFAHAGNRLSGHCWRDRLIGIATDYQAWTVRPHQAEIVSEKYWRTNTLFSQLGFATSAGDNSGIVLACEHICSMWR
jgi:hypothetical protein